MRINCISCGRTLELDDAYDDFEGFVKCCVCGAMLQIRTVEGRVKAVSSPHVPMPPASRSSESEQQTSE
jgi:predicted RNA-binding Zn-ribbon protein involved in translation (DUF1610 family)